MLKNCLFLSFHVSILIGIPVLTTNAFHTNPRELQTVPRFISRVHLTRSHYDEAVVSKYSSLCKTKHHSSTQLSFRQTSPIEEQISTIDLKVELQQQKRSSKRRNMKRRNRKGRARNRRIVQSALPNTNIIPASEAVPNRWRQFRRRRFPRFLLRGKMPQTDFSGSDESILMQDKNESIAEIENDKLESRIDMISPRSINGNQEVKNDTVALVENAYDLDPKSRNTEGKEDSSTDTELKISKEDKDIEIEFNQKQKRQNNLRKGKRIQFSATETSTRNILLDEITCGHFIKYMNQPVEDYSLFSVSEQPINQPLSSRRFNVRRLTRDESNYFEYTNENGKAFMDNFFRLSAPLMPLVGLNLTPIIDLEVTPPTSSSEIEQTDNNLKRWRNRITSSVNGESKDNADTIKIRSMRVDLLSTEAEILDAMKGDRNSVNGIKVQSKPATSVSSNKNVQEFGNEAIGFFERMDKNLQPHLDFDSSVKWTIEDSTKNQLNNSRTYKQVRVTIRSSIVMSLTIPPAVPFAVPSTLIIKQVGSLIAKRVLGLTLPRFLNQLERDFRRWANVPLDEKQKKGENEDRLL